MDKTDRAILDALQKDSSRPMAELAEAVMVSPSACHRRVRALEERGVIEGYVARLDPHRLGLAVEVLVEITLTSQNREAMDTFETAVGGFDDILECHLMSGQADYLLRVAASDLEQFDTLHRNCLARLPGVSAMHTSFVLRRIKRMTGYPVGRG